MAKRVIVYIDGFNLYHAIDDLRKPHLKWVNLFALAQNLLRNGEVLESVKYFSAFATWRPEKYARHRVYIRALEQCGVSTHMGKFKKKQKYCSACKVATIGHEEKESDVRLSIGIVADAYEDRFDRAILISADSDLVPPIEYVRATFPSKEVFVVAPPGRMGTGRDLKPGLEITPGRIAKALLPERIVIENGEQPPIERPREYSPPGT